MTNECKSSSSVGTLLICLGNWHADKIEHMDRNWSGNGSENDGDWTEVGGWHWM